MAQGTQDTCRGPRQSTRDLSENALQAIPRKAFRGATDLKNLQLDKNHISCIEEGAFRALRGLEVLTLNNNNITTIPVSSFNHMPKLRTFRLHSNHLFCDCHLAWLSQWLRQRPTIGLFTQCSGPASLRGLNVAEVQKSEFSCSATSVPSHLLAPATTACGPQSPLLVPDAASPDPPPFSPVTTCDRALTLPVLHPSPSGPRVLKFALSLGARRGDPMPVPLLFLLPLPPWPLGLHAAEGLEEPAAWAVPAVCTHGPPELPSARKALVGSASPPWPQAPTHCPQPRVRLSLLLGPPAPAFSSFSPVGCTLPSCGLRPLLTPQSLGSLL
ncbi:Hypothetical predicted protein [Marmota monax]|uniref:LRRCT domain-containing protein n=1 Tax=Marmota monax TaxID=9995 RepID=A0A5E4AL21_MARMO|nr:Hypothetical predicted protein [Marmota monax]